MKTKRFLLGFLLPSLALVSVVGAGFATWVFDGEYTPINQTIGVTIEDKVNGGELTINQESLTLNLDQPATELNEAGTGITLRNDGSTISELSGSYSGEIPAGYEFTLTYTLELGDVATYVSAVTAGEVGVFTGSGPHSWTLNVTTLNFAYVTPDIATNEGAYDTMYAALSEGVHNITLTIEGNFSVIE